MRTGSKRTCTTAVAHHTTALAPRRSTTHHIGRRFLHLLLAVVALAGFNVTTGRAQAPADLCITQPYINSLHIGTGWNYVTGTVDPIGSTNYHWRVIADGDPGTTEPRTANVIATDPAWTAPLPGSQWIAGTPTSANSILGVTSFEFCFCLRTDQDLINAVLSLRVKADDEARVFLNGTLIGTAAPWAFTTPTTISYSGSTNPPGLFRRGRNCIRVDVRNVAVVASGLNIAGTLTTPGAQIVRQECCEPNNIISGIKFKDLNCNGIRDAGEPGLSGWKIQLNNGQFAITNALGQYQILNVPPGTYTVTEVLQPGWTQTYPAGGGGYTVTVNRNQIITGRDFGNCPEVKCFDVYEPQIRCATLPSGVPGYQYTFWLKNNTTFTAKYLTFSPLTPATGITVSPNPYNMGSVAPGVTTGPLNIFITGANAIPGTTVKLIVKMCNDTVQLPKVCCLDTIEFKLPACDCIDLVEQKIDCKIVNGQKQFTWCFRVRNMSTVPMTYFTLFYPSVPGLTVSPPPMSYILSPNPLMPGQVSTTTYCVTLTGPAAVPGASFTFQAQLCTYQNTYCCKEPFTITLPNCPVSCCDNFVKLLHHMSVSAPWTGGVNLSGYINSWNNPGMVGIIGASFTLVSSTIDGQPAYGYFTQGNIPALGGFGTVPPPPGYPFPHDIQWGLNSTATVLNNSSFNTKMQFPAIAPNKWSDVLRFCIRVRFTDRNCVTCDTVICFTITRYKFIIFPGTISDAPLSGTLVQPGSGRLNLTFPSLPDGSGIRYVGLSVESRESDVTIMEGFSEGRDVYVASGVASVYLNAVPGDQMSMDVVYDNLEDRRSVAHKVILRYVLDHDLDGHGGGGEGEGQDSISADTCEAEIGFVLRMPEYEGGDQLTETAAGAQNVRTFALHLSNSNRTSETISQLVLRAPDGVKVLAVGPTGSPSRATVNFGSSESGTFLSEDIDGARIVLGPGESVEPLYITLGGVQGETVLGFTTLNQFGQPITTGELTLAATPGTPQEEGGASTAGIQQATTGDVTLMSVPNPTSSSATIELALPRSLENVTLVVTDAKGNEVARLLNGGYLSAGDHSLFLSTMDLPTGTYYYTLRANGVVETRSMQVVR